MLDAISDRLFQPPAGSLARIGTSCFYHSRVQDAPYDGLQEKAREFRRHGSEIYERQ
jgi:hypothetical protein